MGRFLKQVMRSRTTFGQGIGTAAGEGHVRQSAEPETETETEPEPRSELEFELRSKSRKQIKTITPNVKIFYWLGAFCDPFHLFSLH